MRIVNLILALAALAGIAFLYAQDDGVDESVERDRLLAIDAKLEAMQRDIASLSAREPASERDPAEAALTQDLNRRLAVLEGYVEALREERAGTQRRDVPDAKPEKKQATDAPALQRWLKALADKSNDTVFASTIELAKLGDPQAISPLTEVLVKHRDFYCRLGAATALGQLEAYESVEALIDALGDQDELVRTASAEALRVITKSKINYVSSGALDERRQAQQRYREWWAEHQQDVTSRIEATR